VVNEVAESGENEGLPLRLWWRTFSGDRRSSQSGRSRKGRGRRKQDRRKTEVGRDGGPSLGQEVDRAHSHRPMVQAGQADHRPARSFGIGEKGPDLTPRRLGGVRKPFLDTGMIVQAIGSDVQQEEREKESARDDTAPEPSSFPGILARHDFPPPCAIVPQVPGF
jgi:hypothetical protein